MRFSVCAHGEFIAFAMAGLLLSACGGATSEELAYDGATGGSAGQVPKTDDSTITDTGGSWSGSGGSEALPVGEPLVPVTPTKEDHNEATCYGWDGEALQPLVPGTWIGDGMVSHWESNTVYGPDSVDYQASCPAEVRRNCWVGWFASSSHASTLEDGEATAGTKCCYDLALTPVLDCGVSSCGEMGESCSDSEPCCAVDEGNSLHCVSGNCMMITLK